jgi:beta-lactam-binding protein with PASTA domain
MTANRTVNAKFVRPAAPAAFAACVVPNVVGLSVVKAKARLLRFHCRVGTVTRKASPAGKKGKVIAQTPKWRRTFRRGTRVSLTIGKGPTRSR